MGDGPQEQPYAAEYDFEEAFERLKDARLRPVRLSIVGLERTKGDIVRREFARVKDARTLEEVKGAVLEVYENLMALGIFDAVDITVDRDPSVSRTLKWNWLGCQTQTHIIHPWTTTGTRCRTDRGRVCGEDPTAAANRHVRSGQGGIRGGHGYPHQSHGPCGVCHAQWRVGQPEYYVVQLGPDTAAAPWPSHFDLISPSAALHIEPEMVELHHPLEGRECLHLHVRFLLGG